ncbi:MAG: homoserine O-acetyltransferase [Flavobacteriaceae bacterium]|nr:homoserine O-acetyltransferase [Flavobacteriaceae bacterium]
MNKQYYTVKNFELESGVTMPELKIAYHTFGERNESQDNVVWAFHALSANSNVLEWWPGLFGENDYFNPKKHFIVCANVIGSPYGSSAPTDLNFPFFTLRDVVKAHLALAEALKIKHIEVAIGGSFGGNQALEFAYDFKGNVKNLILLVSTAQESAWGIAIHQAQRMALTADATFGKPNGGKLGLKAARAIAMLTYRTQKSYHDTQTDSEEKVDNFKAASYIQYQGDKFERRFNALSYYYLSKCLDSYAIGRGRGGVEKALSQFKQSCLLIGIDSDLLIEPHQQKFMARLMPNAVYKEIHSDFGHDGFLIETKAISRCIAIFLASETSAQST